MEPESYPAFFGSLFIVLMTALWNPWVALLVLIALICIWLPELMA